MVVVPRDSLIHGEGGIAQQFFELSLGAISSNNESKRVFNAFLAVSSVGNIIVMTYTAARVKQEIAKEGVLPAAKFFAQSTDMSLGRLLRWFQHHGWFVSPLHRRWLSPEEHSEKTPIGAFVIHFVSCLVLIFATWGLELDSSYNLLSNLNAYVLNGVFGTFLGLGILILRFRGPPAMARDSSVDQTGQPASPRSWQDMTGKHFNPIASVICAVIYMIGNLWPVVAACVRPNANLTLQYKWWLLPSIAWATIGFGAAWFLGFITVAHNIDRNRHKVFAVEKKPEFENACGGGDSASAPADKLKRGGLVVVHETVYISWVGKETLHSQWSQGTACVEEPITADEHLMGTGFRRVVPGTAAG